jgi:hypothetical protein
MPTFDIDLDLPPKERFKKVITHFKPQVRELSTTFIS